MTRFRIFGGRHVHRRPGEPAVTHPGVPAASTRRAATWPPPPAAADPTARHRPATPPTNRTGLTAAVAGGALMLAVPAAAVSLPPDEPAGRPPQPAVLSLVAGDVPAGGAQVATSAARRLATPPPALEVSLLVKAAGLAEAAGQAKAAERAERRQAREAVARCDADLDDLESMRPWARTAARFLSCLYDEPELDRTGGLAVAFEVGGERGDRIAACALANREELGVDTVLWRERANHGEGWQRLSDDEDAAKDEVRISFHRSAPHGTPRATRCL